MTRALAHRHHATRPCRPRSIRKQHRRSIMGCGSSVLAVRTESSNFRPIPERFNTVIDVTDAMRQAGLESSKLLVAVDFTSNSGTGGPCLHDISTGESNPYQQVISVIGRTFCARLGREATAEHTSESLCAFDVGASSVTNLAE